MKDIEDNIQITRVAYQGFCQSKNAYRRPVQRRGDRGKCSVETNIDTGRPREMISSHRDVTALLV